MAAVDDPIVELGRVVKATRPDIEKSKAAPSWFDAPDEALKDVVLRDLRQCLQEDRGYVFTNDYTNLGSTTTCDYPRRFAVETRRQRTGCDMLVQGQNLQRLEKNWSPQIEHDRLYQTRILALRELEHIVRSAGLAESRFRFRMDVATLDVRM